MPNKQKRKKWLVIGNGMAGMNTVEQVIKLAPDLYDITVIGSEPYPNYNRIQLSYVLEGSKTVEDIVLNDYDWYKNNNIDLHTGRTAEHIDREKSWCGITWELPILMISYCWRQGLTRLFCLFPEQILKGWSASGIFPTATA